MAFNLELEEKRIKTLKSIKPLAEINGIRYYSSDEHQKFLDSVDPEEKVYHREKDEHGKTVFNGVNRLVINPVEFFALAYKVDEENEKFHFVVDQLAMYAKRKRGKFEVAQVQGYTCSIVDGVIQDDYTIEYFKREDFLSNFGGNLYEENPKKTIEIFKALADLEHAVPKSNLKFK